MADIKEEEYLDELLKSMSDSKSSTVADTDVAKDINSSEQHNNYSTVPDKSADDITEDEDADMAMLSQMLLNDNDIAVDNETAATLEQAGEMHEELDNSSLDEPVFEDSEPDEPVLEDNESDELVLEDNGPDESVLEEQGLSEPTIEDEGTEDDFDDNISLDDLLSQAQDDINNEEPESLDFHYEDEDNHSISELGDDSELFNNLQELIDSDSPDEQTSDTQLDEPVLEEQAPDNKLPDEPLDSVPQNTDELSDILALDDGVSFDDIPSESAEPPLSEADMNKVAQMNEAADVEKDSDNKEEAEKVTDKKDKKIKKKKEKTPKEPKKKKKFSIKDFFMKFSDEEEPEEVALETLQADANQQLINELYGDENSLDRVEPGEDPAKTKKVKKEKKPKTPKEKKPKKVKAPKEKKPGNPSDNQKIGFGSIFKALIFVAIMVVIVKIGGGYVHYKLTVKSAKDYYLAGQYTQAYDEIAGVDIKSKDKDFYNELRLIMTVRQGIDSYNNYMQLGMKPEALDALIRAAARRNSYAEEIDSYGITDKVTAVYNNILTLLEQHGITEQDALDYNSMTNYDEYYELLNGLQ